MNNHNNTNFPRSSTMGYQEPSHEENETAMNDNKNNNNNNVISSSSSSSSHQQQQNQQHLQGGRVSPVHLVTPSPASTTAGSTIKNNYNNNDNSHVFPSNVVSGGSGNGAGGLSPPGGSSSFNTSSGRGIPPTTTATSSSTPLESHQSVTSHNLSILQNAALQLGQNNILFSAGARGVGITPTRDQSIGNNNNNNNSSRRHHQLPQLPTLAVSDYDSDDAFNPMSHFHAEQQFYNSSNNKNGNNNNNNNNDQQQTSPVPGNNASPPGRATAAVTQQNQHVAEKFFISTMTTRENSASRNSPPSNNNNNNSENNQQQSQQTNANIGNNNKTSTNSANLSPRRSTSRPPQTTNLTSTPTTNNKNNMTSNNNINNSKNKKSLNGDQDDTIESEILPIESTSVVVKNSKNNSVGSSSRQNSAKRSSTSANNNSKNDLAKERSSSSSQPPQSPLDVPVRASNNNNNNNNNSNNSAIRNSSFASSSNNTNAFTEKNTRNNSTKTAAGASASSASGPKKILKTKGEPIQKKDKFGNIYYIDDNDDDDDDSDVFDDDAVFEGQRSRRGAKETRKNDSDNNNNNNTTDGQNESGTDDPTRGKRQKPRQQRRYRHDEDFDDDELMEVADDDSEYPSGDEEENENDDDDDRGSGASTEEDEGESTLPVDEKSALIPARLMLAKYDNMQKQSAQQRILSWISESVVEFLYFVFQFIKWAPPKYNFRTAFVKDFIGGVVMSVMLLPMGLAYAKLLRLPPLMGVYSSAWYSGVYAFVGSTSKLSMGPAAETTLMLMDAPGLPGPEHLDDRIRILVVVTMQVGLFTFIYTIFRGGNIIRNTLSRTVAKAYATAAGVLLILSQIKSIFNLEISRSTVVAWDTIGAAAVACYQQCGAESFYSALLFCVFAGYLFGVKHVWKSCPSWVPHQLIIVLFSIFVTSVLGLHERANISIIQDVPVATIKVGVPTFSWNEFLGLLAYSGLFAVVSFLQMYGIASNMNPKVDANQELFSQGLCATVTSLLGGFAGCSSFSRCSVLDILDVQTPLCSLVASVLLIFYVEVLVRAGFFYYMPNVVLTAIIVSSVIKLVDFSVAVKLWDVSKADFVVWVVTFLGVANLGVTTGISAGIGLSILIVLLKVSSPAGSIVAYDSRSGSYRSTDGDNELLVMPGLLIWEYGHPLYFINVNSLKVQLEQAVVREHRPIEIIVLDLSHSPGCDSSAAETFNLQVKTFKDSQSIEVYVVLPQFCEARNLFAALPNKINFKMYDSVLAAVAQASSGLESTLPPAQRRIPRAVFETEPAEPTKLGNALISPARTSPADRRVLCGTMALISHGYRTPKQKLKSEFYDIEMSEILFGKATCTPDNAEIKIREFGDSRLSRVQDGLQSAFAHSSVSRKKALEIHTKAALASQAVLQQQHQQQQAQQLNNNNNNNNPIENSGPLLNHLNGSTPQRVGSIFVSATTATPAAASSNNLAASSPMAAGAAIASPLVNASGAPLTQQQQALQLATYRASKIDTEQKLLLAKVSSLAYASFSSQGTFEIKVRGFDYDGEARQFRKIVVVVKWGGNLTELGYAHCRALGQTLPHRLDLPQAINDWNVLRKKFEKEEGGLEQIQQKLLAEQMAASIAEAGNSVRHSRNHSRIPSGGFHPANSANTGGNGNYCWHPNIGWYYPHHRNESKSSRTSTPQSNIQWNNNNNHNPNFPPSSTRYPPGHPFNNNNLLRTGATPSSLVSQQHPRTPSGQLKGTLSRFMSFLTGGNEETNKVNNDEVDKDKNNTSKPSSSSPNQTQRQQPQQRQILPFPPQNPNDPYQQTYRPNNHNELGAAYYSGNTAPSQVLSIPAPPPPPPSQQQQQSIQQQISTSTSPPHDFVANNNTNNISNQNRRAGSVNRNQPQYPNNSARRNSLPPENISNAGQSISPRNNNNNNNHLNVTNNGAAIYPHSPQPLHRTVGGGGGGGIAAYNNMFIESNNNNNNNSFGVKDDHLTHGNVGHHRRTKSNMTKEGFHQQQQGILKSSPPLQSTSSSANLTSQQQPFSPRPGHPSSDDRSGGGQQKVRLPLTSSNERDSHFRNTANNNYHNSHNHNSHRQNSSNFPSSGNNISNNQRNSAGFGSSSRHNTSSAPKNFHSPPLFPSSPNDPLHQQQPPQNNGSFFGMSNSVQKSVPLGSAGQSKTPPGLKTSTSKFFSSTLGGLQHFLATNIQTVEDTITNRHDNNNNKGGDTFDEDDANLNLVNVEYLRKYDLQGWVGSFANATFKVSCESGSEYRVVDTCNAVTCSLIDKLRGTNVDDPSSLSNQHKELASTAVLPFTIVYNDVLLQDIPKYAEKIIDAHVSDVEALLHREDSIDLFRHITGMHSILRHHQTPYNLVKLVVELTKQFVHDIEHSILDQRKNTRQILHNHETVHMLAMRYKILLMQLLIRGDELPASSTEFANAVVSSSTGTAGLNSNNNNNNAASFQFATNPFAATPGMASLQRRDSVFIAGQQLLHQQISKSTVDPSNHSSPTYQQQQQQQQNNMTATAAAPVGPNLSSNVISGNDLTGLNRNYSTFYIAASLQNAESMTRMPSNASYTDISSPMIGNNNNNIITNPIPSRAPSRAGNNPAPIANGNEKTTTSTKEATTQKEGKNEKESTTAPAAAAAMPTNNTITNPASGTNLQSALAIASMNPVVAQNRLIQAMSTMNSIFTKEKRLFKANRLKDLYDNAAYDAAHNFLPLKDLTNVNLQHLTGVMGRLYRVLNAGQFGLNDSEKRMTSALAMVPVWKKIHDEIKKMVSDFGNKDPETLTFPIKLMFCSSVQAAAFRNTMAFTQGTGPRMTDAAAVNRGGELELAEMAERGWHFMAHFVFRVFRIFPGASGNGKSDTPPSMSAQKEGGDKSHDNNADQNQLHAELEEHNPQIVVSGLNNNPSSTSSGLHYNNLVENNLRIQHQYPQASNTNNNNNDYYHSNNNNNAFNNRPFDQFNNNNYYNNTNNNNYHSDDDPLYTNNTYNNNNYHNHPSSFNGRNPAPAEGIDRRFSSSIQELELVNQAPQNIPSQQQQQQQHYNHRNPGAMSTKSGGAKSTKHHHHHHGGSHYNHTNFSNATPTPPSTLNNTNNNKNNNNEPSSTLSWTNNYRDPLSTTSMGHEGNTLCNDQAQKQTAQKKIRKPLYEIEVMASSGVPLAGSWMEKSAAAIMKDGSVIGPLVRVAVFSATDLDDFVQEVERQAELAKQSYGIKTTATNNTIVNGNGDQNNNNNNNHNNMEP